MQDPCTVLLLLCSWSPAYHYGHIADRPAFLRSPLCHNLVLQIRFIQMAVPKLLQRLPEAPPVALWITAILFYLLALSLKVKGSVACLCR